MKRVTPLVLMLSIIFISCGSSTRLTKSWRDPDTQVSLDQLSKVLVVSFLKSETNRRASEDKMVSLLSSKGVNGVPSYNYFPNGVGNLEEDGIRDKLKTDDFDGAVTLRLIDVDKEVNYTPGSFTTYPVYYRTFGGYLRRGWTYYSTQDRYSTTKTYSVETNVYSMKQDKLIWSGLTETSDPGGVDKLTEDVSATIFKRMQQEGFITK